MPFLIKRGPGGKKHEKYGFSARSGALSPGRYSKAPRKGAPCRKEEEGFLCSLCGVCGLLAVGLHPRVDLSLILVDDILQAGVVQSGAIGLSVGIEVSIGTQFRRRETC